jgi:heme exporter protein D
VLGRGALFLASGAFNLASWLFSALVFLIGLVASIKSMTERLTMAFLRRAREQRLRRALAAATA